jgi:hypothetical protein
MARTLNAAGKLLAVATRAAKRLLPDHHDVCFKSTDSGKRRIFVQYST